MTVVLHVSDPHFGTEQAHVVEALIRVAHQEGPALVILSGDITQRARRAQFSSARDFVARLGAPAVLAVPGNHDIPLFDVVSRICCPYARYRAAFGEELEPVHQSERLLAIGVNTTRARRHKHGEVSVSQIERVSARLRAAGAFQLRIVVTHQPVHVITARDRNNLLRGADEAVRAWAAAGADAILGGHIHLPYVRPLSERVPGLPRRAWCVQAGTAVSSRVRGTAPNSVNLLRYTEPSVCTVERWDFEADGARFARAVVERLALDR
jgi:3',5'-cyclic AMP phosphodiesterase CpdA